MKHLSYRELLEIEALSELDQQELVLMEYQNYCQMKVFEENALAELSSNHLNEIETYLLYANETNQIEAFLSTKKNIGDTVRFRKEYDISKIPETFYKRYRDHITRLMPSLSENQINQLTKYIYVVEYFKIKSHWIANHIISLNDDWDSYADIRSINRHGNDKTVKGIIPKCFFVIIRLCQFNRGKGGTLEAFERY